MKTIASKLILWSFLMIGFIKVDAQNGDGMPPFKMLMTNGKFFSAAELQKNKPVVLIYFAPDCDHCQVLMNEFFKNIESFKAVQIVLVTFKPLQELAAFENLYKTDQYPNVKTGTEGNTYFLRKFFRLDSTPFTALYSKEGQLIYSYRKETNVSDLLARVKQLK